MAAVDDDVRDLKEIPIENEEWMDNLRNRRYIPAIIAAPFTELFSVAVDPKYFGQRDMIQIYGTIFLYDQDKNRLPYDLYCRESDDAETLTPQHNLLSLDMPVQCLVSTTWSHMCLSLKDKADGAVVVDQYFDFVKITDIDEYNKVKRVDINYVSVTYAAFSAAVVAVLEITLIKTNDSVSVPLSLSGKIITRCGNTYGHKYPGIVLYNTPSDKPIEALSNVPILLSRDVVVVPAYSFLRIDLHLSHHHLHQQQDDITCRADFLARYLHVDERDIVVKDFVVRFKVQWCHPDQLYDDAKQACECPKISTDLQVHDVDWSSLAEVYTVMIHHDTSRELQICGKLLVRDNWTLFSLFNRKVRNPIKLSGNTETIPIDVKRRCFNMSDYLCMGLKLRDVEGEVMIQGVVNWNDYHVKEPISWFDKRICSVFRGVHGYAAVFYSIFSKARQAEVQISFECDGYKDVGYSLHGSVVARHTKETYMTELDKAYYQSVLFRGTCPVLKSGYILPLLKSVVAVPIDALLTVVIDLYASPLSPELPQEHLRSDFTFNRVPAAKRFKGEGNWIINVCVKWGDVDKLMSAEEKDFNDSDSE